MVMSLSHEINVLCGPSDGSPLANVRDGQKSNHNEGSNRKRITYAVYTYTYMFIVPSHHQEAELGQKASCSPGNWPKFF